jgi:multisubunit Na+/H+ antiporter MnhF subunit
MQPEVLVDTGLVVISVAFFVALIRFVRGPTLPDRVVAVDLLGVSAVCLIVLAAARTRQMDSMDVALVIALLGFLGTIAYARYAERGGPR